MLRSGVDLHGPLIVICNVDKQDSVIARSRMKNDAIAAHALAQLRVWDMFLRPISSQRSMMPCGISSGNEW